MEKATLFYRDTRETRDTTLFQNDVNVVYLPVVSFVLFVFVFVFCVAVFDGFVSAYNVGYDVFDVVSFAFVAFF